MPFRQLESASGRLTAYGRAFVSPAVVVRVRGRVGDVPLEEQFLMSNCADAARLSPDERFREVAAILAAGVLRLRHMSVLSAEKTENNLAKVPPNGLEVPTEMRLSVSGG
jgi:hypothetical protein